MIAVEDGDNLTVPLGFYPSKDEPTDVVEKIQQAIKAIPRHHGWAAARADLNDPENLKQYEDVYQRTADYFAAVKC
ncbi:uncharacterized protein I206_106105 [Kwoniella pini CBS 10737]|uniref:Uncharacterized protein n=1 Tax=Kwoniella pini CBS 10737 TaxID=1296096 RepID=A0AAJ8LAL7_9TREE